MHSINQQLNSCLALNYDHWISEVVQYQTASKNTTEDLERPSSDASGKEGLFKTFARICRRVQTWLETTSYDILSIPFQ